jgi:hypothetical protein
LSPATVGDVYSDDRGTDDVRNEEKTLKEMEARLLGPSSVSTCGGLSATAAALEAEEGWDI